MSSVVGKAPWEWGKGVLGESLQGALCMVSLWSGSQHSALSPWWESQCGGDGTKWHVMGWDGMGGMDGMHGMVWDRMG